MTEGAREMQVKIRLFAGLREAMGWSERLVRTGGLPATPLLLWRQLELAEGWARACAEAGSVPEQHRSDPEAPRSDAEVSGEALPAELRVAINQAFAAADTPLSDGDEVAFLPPISGG